MNFRSDNVAGADPAIMAALTEANAGSASPYGDDPWTRRLTERVAEVFEIKAAVFPVATGSAANALALSVLTRPYGAVYCHDDSHINTDECGAPELFTGGAKLIPLTGVGAKVAPDILDAALAKAKPGFVHRVQPAVVSLTQATEAGRVYRPDEVAAVCAVARRHGLAVHMDGARFANAVVRLGCTPADLTWRAGVDVLCLGATKNGTWCAEAVIFFDPARAADFAYRRKRGGHLLSKMRFISAQLDAYLENDHWLTLARHANAMADRLAAGLIDLVDGAALADPVEANEVFIRLPQTLTQRLLDAGVGFYPWDGEVVRLVTCFATTDAEVDEFLDLVRRVC